MRKNHQHLPLYHLYMLTVWNISSLWTMSWIHAHSLAFTYFKSVKHVLHENKHLLVWSSSFTSQQGFFSSKLYGCAFKILNNYYYYCYCCWWWCSHLYYTHGEQWWAYLIRVCRVLYILNHSEVARFYICTLTSLRLLYLPYMFDLGRYKYLLCGFWFPCPHPQHWLPKLVIKERIRT